MTLLLGRAVNRRLPPAARTVKGGKKREGGEKRVEITVPKSQEGMQQARKIAINAG